MVHMHFLLYEPWNMFYLAPDYRTTLYHDALYSHTLYHFPFVLIPLNYSMPDSYASHALQEVNVLSLLALESMGATALFCGTADLFKRTPHQAKCSPPTISSGLEGVCCLSVLKGGENSCQVPSRLKASRLHVAL